MKLNTKIAIFILEIALIPLIFIGYVLYSNQKVAINQTTLKEVDAIAQIQKNRLQDILIQKQDMVGLFVTNPFIRSYMQTFNTRTTSSLQKSINESLLEIKSGSVKIKKIFITEPAGVVVASTDSALLGTNVSTEDYFKQGIKKQDVSFLKKDDTGATVEYLVAPLASNGKLLGMVALVTDASDIVDLANDYTGLGNTGETLLVKDDGNGNALYLTPIRFDPNAGLVRVVSKERKNVPAIHAKNGEEGVFNNLVDYRNIPVFAATRYIGSINWGIVVKIDKIEALTPIRKLQELFLLIILSVIVLIIFLTIPISNAIAAKEDEIDKQKNEFISLASHQLKNPITAISWNLESLLDGDKGPVSEDQKEVLKRAYESSENMAELVAGFLDITKMEHSGFVIETGDVDLVQMADSVLGELAKQISDRKIIIIKKYGDNIPHLNIGSKTSRIIFQNLLTNAVRYTPENGTVETLIEKTAAGVSISVKDNGYGIPEEAKSRIFTKLFRADNIKEKEPSGTGLGLYLVKSLVDKLGGKIWFESKEGVGSTFHVNLKV